MPGSVFLLAAALASAAPSSAGPAPSSRSIEATYVATVAEVPAGLERLEVWIPLPSGTPNQRIEILEVDSPYTASVRREGGHGNSYLHLTANEPRPGALEVRVRFEAERREILRAASRRAGRREGAQDLRKYLEADRFVTLSPRVRRLARQVTYGHRAPEAKARAIYDYVVNTMTYDKTAPGWGQGDTERACDVQKGNCTDFHSLFISLARAEGIPARFVIGFPLGKEAEGTIPGYHCWAEFHLPARGWLPVDTSDASKSSDPRRRSYLFGNLDPDRIQFTVGRDLRLDPPPCAEPLNYFIYPHAEGDGKVLSPVAIRLEYRDRASKKALAAIRNSKFEIRNLLRAGW